MLMLTECFPIFLNRWEDLVVGAPFYNQPGIGGAIYVYKNDAKVFYTICN